MTCQYVLLTFSHIAVVKYNHIAKLVIPGPNTVYKYTTHQYWLTSRWHIKRLISIYNFSKIAVNISLLYITR